MHPTVVFFPENDKVLVPLHWDGQYFKGLLSAYCSIAKKWLTFLTFDHGAYPWGRSPLRGALAGLCRLVGISTNTGTFNCCLICHLLVAILDMDLFSIKDLYTSHLPLLKKYMVSKIKRDHDDVINDVLDSLNLTEKISVRTILRVGHDTNFSLSTKSIGNPNGKTVFLTFDGKKEHFFLAKPHPSRSSGALKAHPSTPIAARLDTSSISLVTPPPRVRFLQDIDFGTPPDDDLLMDESQFDDIDEPFF